MTPADEALVERIARVCHAAACEMQDLAGDGYVSVPWIHLDAETRAIVRAGVRAVLGGATPRQLHEQWVRDKAAAGWTCGPRDETAKRHPNMVPWDELPGAQRAKDRVFCGIVDALRPEDDGLDDGETYGETWWRVYGAAHHYGGFGPWDELAHENQVAIEAASQAVGARVLRALECAEDAHHPEGCDCQFCREDEREERDRDDRIEAAEEAEFLADAASLDTDLEEDL